MKIRNIRESETHSRVCYFDLELDGDLLLSSIRLLKIDENKFALGLMSATKRTYFSCCSSKAFEDRVIEKIINVIPQNWIDAAEVVVFKSNYIDIEKKTLLVEIDL